MNHSSAPQPKGVATASASQPKHCPDRLERAKTGGFLGSVFGTLAASVLGSPILGGAYQVAGYAMGFASAETCAKAEKLEKAEKVEKIEKIEKVEETVEAPALKPKPEVSLVAAKITEENL